MAIDYRTLIEGLSKDTPKQQTDIHRILLVDGLNLFFRNFATMNTLNRDGSHVGGLAGFLRSLGSLIKLTDPGEVIIIFDGPGSSINRKNLVSEYKSNRGIHRITNWDIFESLEEEDDAKVGQITRLIQYLQCLPVTLLMIEKAEADDVIAFISQTYEHKPKTEVIIASSDKDYLQLCSETIKVYLPNKKEFYSPKEVLERFEIPSYNFLVYKTLLGDKGDKVDGIKGLGPKTLLKLFPELKKTEVTLEDIFDIAEKKLTENVIYARIVQARSTLQQHYKIMNLHTPILDEDQKLEIQTILQEANPTLLKKPFLQMSTTDELERVIRNINWWLPDTFMKLVPKEN
jgi:DNA polymerase-1